MHEVHTEERRIVQPSVTLEAGRILVVDDDRNFGGFMLAALESRGHTVDWAGCIADALATLFAARYDLLIVDLRLPDGNGLSLVRDAADEGLLAASSAIILTGHDFDQPDDIRVFRKSFELEPFLDRMGEIVAATRRRRRPLRPPASARGSASDLSRSRKVKIELVMYTSSASEKCRKALRTIREVLERYDRGQVHLEICDLAQRPEAGTDDAVVFTPTLVKRGPGPKTWIVGNLEQTDLLVDLLELHGVDRQRD